MEEEGKKERGRCGGGGDGSKETFGKTGGDREIGGTEDGWVQGSWQFLFIFSLKFLLLYYKIFLIYLSFYYYLCFFNKITKFPAFSRKRGKKKRQNEDQSLKRKRDSNFHFMTHK